MKISSLLTTVLLLSTTAGYAADANVDSPAAFARLKALAGEWTAQTKEGEAHLSYEVISGGTVLVERESTGKMPPMLTVYYVDGNRLLLTHYCMAGNQPRMQARHFDPNTGEIEFDFLDATNLASPSAGHMHNAKLRLIDNDHLASEWQFYENGQPKFAEAVEYTRLK